MSATRSPISPMTRWACSFSKRSIAKSGNLASSTGQREGKTMLDFTKHPVRITHMNTRVEEHGDEEKKMLDLRIEADLPNTVLDRFSPSLRPSLFSTDEQPELEPDGQHLPHVKNPELGTLTWTNSYHPVSLQLHTDARRSKNDVRLKDAKLGKIRLRPKEGGTIGFV